MTTNVFYRRRAERFAQLLDEASGGRRHHVRDRAEEELAEFIAVSDHLTAVKPQVEIDPDFRTGLRAMLVAKAERDGIGATAVEAPEPGFASESRPRFTGRRIRARGAVIVGVAVGAIAVSGMSAASENAMPGDALYGVKRSTERAQLALASSDVTRGQLFLDFARTRLAEAGAVGDTTGFSGVLDDMDSDTREGAKLLHTAAVARRDATPLDAVDTFVSGQRQQITKMLDRLPAASRDRAVASLAVLDQVSQRSKSLRATLDCGDAATVGADVLGPKPGTCWSAPSQGRSGPASDPDSSQRTDAKPAPERTEGTDPKPAGSAGTTTPPGTPAPDGSTPADQPAPTPTSTEGGLLDGLGRILGDLLG
ncbi:DUF5667 domain-containing protein [Phytohabitans sp. ZYX-F-186]|uniref:DUF5667 domain-containing protein n=1 Tax=Phytohabitans maris TaxID=3071409 RepID=A0ABU0ZI44_9ACTN|nr:DUF5667 domain-containing protein [Phytohabitans sp. ZYX-F-186]MDQ7906723.1 DUF5667 domain-containing protein [Phytohabitans sp. ZYX-F-186]